MKSTTKGAIVGNAMVLARFYFFEEDLDTQGLALGMAAAMWFPILWDAAFGDGAPFAPSRPSDGTPPHGQQGGGNAPRD